MPVEVEIWRKSMLLGHGTAEAGDFAVRRFQRDFSGDIPGVGQAIKIKARSGPDDGKTLETQSGGLYGNSLWITHEIEFREPA